LIVFLIPLLQNPRQAVQLYGFGWSIGKHKGKKYIQHDGYWLAFISYYIRFPEEHLSVIILLNRDYDLPEKELDLEIAELYL
jgi:CubicO group peptidase (beta-lactamase class C family)